MNNMQTTISVILPVYKEKCKYIIESIDSILSQTFKKFELIIVVDNPKIESYINDTLKKYSNRDSRIKLIYNSSNLGLAESINVGINNSESDYIARMDADDISLNDRLEKQIAHIQKYPIDILSTGILYIDENDNFLRVEKNISLVPDKTLPFFCSIFHPTIIAKRKVFEKYGKYYNLSISEDYELYLRLLYNGVKFGMLNEPLLKYRIRKDSLSRNKIYKTRLAFQYINSNYKFCMKKKEYSFDLEKYNKYINSNFEIDEKKFCYAIDGLKRIRDINNPYKKLKHIVDVVIKSPIWSLTLVFENIFNKFIVILSNKFSYENKKCN